MMKGNSNKKNYSVLGSRGLARACSLVLLDVNVMALVYRERRRETSRQCAGHSSWPTAAAAAAGRLFSAFPFSKKV